MSLDLVIACIDRGSDWNYWLSQRNLLQIKPCVNALILVGSTHIARVSSHSAEHRPILTEHSGRQREELANRPFNKAKALRSGTLYSDAEIVMFLDCDLRIAPGMLKLLYHECHSSPIRTCLYLQRVVESDPQLRQSHYNGYQPVCIADISGDTKIMLMPWQTSSWRPGFGNVILPRQLYLEVGMHDPSYTQYGWEDHDLLIRLQLAGADVRAQGQACHLSHPNSMRCLNDMSRQQSTRIMRQIFIEKFRHLLINNDAYATHPARHP